mgnify:CR=1 FL=1
MIWSLRVTLDGQRGRLRGEVGDPRQGIIAARAFASGVRALRDTAGGSAGGRVRYPVDHGRNDPDGD